jgi:hypothetical protein
MVDMATNRRMVILRQNVVNAMHVLTWKLNVVKDVEIKNEEL